MSDETKPGPGVLEYVQVLRAAMAEFLPGSTQQDAQAIAEADARADERVRAQLAANDERFGRELAFRERMVAEQLRAQAAATILAALIQAHATANQHNGHVADLPDGYAKAAVAWADALRAELAKGGKP